jgi:endonuclease G, mitochondrial
MVITIGGRDTLDSYERERRRQREAAATRIAERTAARVAHEEALSGPGGIAAADTAERIADRLDRLGRYYAGEPAPEAGIERIINSPDFVDIRYLDAGVAAARAIGRVNIRDGRGRLQGYGTGSLVSPALLLTNHHVLPDADTARSSAIEFNYQDGLDGRPLLPQVFPLDPDRFFIADEERDCALVAVRATAAELAPFGFNRLIEAPGKVIIGEFVTIVQHPRGEKKQIALRENRIVDIPELFLHYTADTEPGSSGSLAFNDQWQAVALHHASVPAPDHRDLGGFVNEGIRISRIVELIKQQPLGPEQRALADEIFAAARREAAPPAPARASAPASPPPPSPDGHVTFTVPVQITVRVGNTGPQAVATAIDPDYSSRGGYDPAFLARPLPLPALAPELAAVASAELRYHHFTVVMHRMRAVALYTAVNIEGKTAERPRRESDRWILDPRLPASEQTGEAVYRDNPLDRGHLVRRLDPAWGGEALAKAANDDTFHFTNAAPQHHEFNAGSTLWAGLEDFVLENADTADLAVSVLTGPVLAEDDDAYRGVRLPRQFWKVVAMVKRCGELSVTGYLLSQAALLDGLAATADFSYGAYRTFQVPVRRIAALTGLGLEPHIAADPLERLEAAPLPRELIRPQDLIL